MDKNFLTGKLSEYVRIKDELVETEEISEKVSMLKIRDTLLLIGNIIKEDLDEEFYIGTINAGIANKNIAFIQSLFLSSESAYGYKPDADT